MRKDGRPHVVYIVGTALTADVLLRGQLRHLVDCGWKVTLICSPDVRLNEIAAREGAGFRAVPIERDIDVWRDLGSLYRLWVELKGLRPDVVHASTPKAGLLGMLAARFAGVPARVYLLRGLRLETVSGPKRELLALLERVASFCASDVWAVSESLRSRYEELGLNAGKDVVVLGHGSSNGVDCERFRPRDRGSARRELGITGPGPVVGFVGRLAGDKGLLDVASVLDELRLAWPRLEFLCAGGEESVDSVADALLSRMRGEPRNHMLGFIEGTEQLYAACDVLLFPSAREGFPNAPLEAAACGCPTVGYAATGTVDAVVDGVTGRLVRVGDAASLAAALAEVLCDGERRVEMGRAARERAVTAFERGRVWAGVQARLASLSRLRPTSLADTSAGGNHQASNRENGDGCERVEGRS